MRKFLIMVLALGMNLSAIAQCNYSLPILEQFNSSSVLDVCWDIEDQDGDGSSWYWREYSSYYGGHKTLSSYSFTTANGALNPDNWIKSHAIDLSAYAAGDIITLSWKVRGELVGFAHEFYSVYASTNNSLTSLQASTVNRSEYVDDVGGEGVFVTRSLDLSSLAPPLSD